MEAISIHALREEGDCPSDPEHCCRSYFYPRPPRGGRPSTLAHGSPYIQHFYPRPPRGGRLHFAPDARPPKNFYPRPLRGGRLWVMRYLPPLIYFYPRPLRGGRLIISTNPPGLSKFLSTPSARRATVQDVSRAKSSVISIHALCEEGDGSSSHRPCRCRYFYPRPLRGGRQPLSPGR